MKNMESSYQTGDFDIIDYLTYSLEGIGERLRGPKPEHLAPKEYFICIGSAHTFGCFCEYPYSRLLKDLLNLEVLNLGFAGAGPEFLSEKLDNVIDKYINNSKFVVIQIVSARGSSNSLFERIKGGQKVIRRSDGKEVFTKKAYEELLKSGDRELVSKIVAETRQTWLESYQQLLKKITVPKILFWFSTRQPYYQESYKIAGNLWGGGFPQLVNLNMVDSLREYTNNYVECVSRKGLPQKLINRFTGKPTTRKGKTNTTNNYYPSPEMHREGAGVLEKVCRKYL